MKRILFATDTYKEAIYFMRDIGDALDVAEIRFSADKYRMEIKAEDALIVFVPQTSNHSGLYQRYPFDYYILTGDAYFFDSGWHDFCISRIKIGAKPIESREELIMVLTGEDE